jgi:hypothetical protein
MTDLQACIAESVVQRSTGYETPCLLWQGPKDEDGYGRLHLNGKRSRAHRTAYEDANGQIPEGLVLDHLCRIRHCVNPDHLEPVTNGENVHRAGAARRAAITHCPKGHEYTPENSYFCRRGTRSCRSCRADAKKRWAARNPTYWRERRAALRSAGRGGPA